MRPQVTRTLVAIVLLGAALRFAAIDFGLPYPDARPDEEVAIGKALEALDGRPNPRFFHWPSLTFYTFAGVLHVARQVHESIGGTRELTAEEQHLVARSVIALAGTTTLLVLFCIGRRVGNDALGLTAALFLAVAILHVRDSHFAMTDVLMTLLLWLSLLALCEATADAERAVTWCAVGGWLAGLAASTKYSAAAGAAGMLVVQLLLFVREPGRLRSLRNWVPSLAFAACALGGFIAGTPYSIIDYERFRADLAFDFTHLSRGHEGVNLGRGWIYHLTHSLPYGAGLPLFAAAMVGIVPLVRRGPAAILLAAFAAAFYATIGSGFTVFFRYVLPLVPFVCLAAAAGVLALAHWIARTSGMKPSLALGALLALTAGPAAVQCMRLDLLLARTDTRVLAADWLASRVRAGESLHDAGGRYTQLDLRQLKLDRWEYEGTTGNFSGGAKRLPDWLVLDESPLRAYTPAARALWDLARRDYHLVALFPGTPARSDALYDRQDAFFAPITGFSSLERPGPTIHIYRRR